VFSHIQRFSRAHALAAKLAPTKRRRIHAQRLRRLHALVAEQAPTEWGRSYVENHLAQPLNWRHAYCARFAGIVEESGDQAVILGATESDLAVEMAGLLTNDIPIRPVELIDLDTGQRRLAICEATVHFITPIQRERP
jgi:hypothetical protein